MGYEMSYENAAQIMDEIAATTPTFAGVSFEHLDRVGSLLISRFLLGSSSWISAGNAETWQRLLADVCTESPAWGETAYYFRTAGSAG
jgi:hypothetical protein